MSVRFSFLRKLLRGSRGRHRRGSGSHGGRRSGRRSARSGHGIAGARLSGIGDWIRQRHLLWAMEPVVRRWGGVALAAVIGVAGGALFLMDREEVPVGPVVSLPSLPPLPTRFEGVPLATQLARAGIREDDDFLRSELLRDPEFTEAVHGWVGYWTGPAREWFPGFLSRMAWLGATVDSAVAANEFPPSLRYLPLIESGYDPRVTSRVGAVGLWQLMPPTARGLGLTINPLVDERRDPERATAAALEFLGDLQGEFQSWHITLAAYNWGPTRMRRILRRHAPDAPRTDSLYWALREHLPAETREFLPKLYAAMWVASRPEAYGYDVPVAEALRFETVPVFYQTTLDIVALAAGASHAEVVRLNPQLLRGVTPHEEHTAVRLPEGTARRFRTIYPRIRPEDRTTFLHHVVQPGETLAGIAEIYGVPVEEMQAANPRVPARDLPVATRLSIPVAPSVPDEAGTSDEEAPSGGRP